jgi:hypothetical protein
MKINPKIISEIAQQLEAGMKVYLNKDTHEIKSIFDWDEITDYELVEKEENEILQEWSNYVEFTKMESHEAFDVMEEFAVEIENINLREEVLKVLGRKRPFANFKAIVETSDYRDKWFEFRRKKYIEYIKKQLEAEEFDI